MLETLLYWHWIVLGIILIILEMLLPGFVLMWFGAGALLVGSLLYILPDITWQWQFLIFSVFSILSLVGWRLWSKNHSQDDPDSGVLNQRGKALVGRKTILIEPIVNGVGRVQLDDTFWRVNGDELNQGQLVLIVDVDGATLKVEAA